MGGRSPIPPAAAGGNEGFCPACDRHIGTVEECPYCGVEPPWAGRVRALKAGSALVAVAGTAILLATARCGVAPAVRVPDLAPVHQIGRAWPAVAGIAAVCGAAGAVAACVPGLHIFALLAFLSGSAAAGLFGSAVPGFLLVGAFAAVAAGHSVAGSLPAVLLGAPDDTSFPAVRPAGRQLSEGLGVRTGFLTILGGLGASIILGLGVLPAARFASPMLGVLRPHLHWAIWAMIVFVLMSNRPGERLIGGTAASRLARDLVPTAAGFFVFILSGLLGCVLFFCAPPAVAGPYPGLAPAFAGLFAAPWLLAGFAAPRAPLPRQSMRAGAAPSLGSLVSGAAAGSAGGVFAAAAPAFTGGIGNLISSRAAPPAGGAAFFISQGAVRVLYCAGGMALCLLPGDGPPFGGTGCLADAVRGAPAEGCLPAAAVGILVGAVSGAAAGAPLCAGLAAAVGRFGRRTIGAAALAALAGAVLATSGFAGFGVLIAASAIGTTAALHRADPANALGAALVPAACSLSGFGPAIAGILGNG